MCPSLIKRFMHKVCQGLWGEVTDRTVELLIFLAGIVFLIAQNGWSFKKLPERWQAISSGVFVISGLLVWHAFRSAYALNKELQIEESQRTASYSPIYSPQGQPIKIEAGSSYSFAPAKLYGIASCLTLCLALASYLCWQKIPKMNVVESPPNVPSPENPKPEPTPKSSPPLVIRPQFKASALFTPNLKQSITTQINLFYQYLTGLGFKLPTDVPLIGVSPVSVAVSNSIQPGPFSEAAILIPKDRMRDSREVVSLYALYVFRDIFPYPLTSTGQEVGPKGRFNPYTQMLYATYYTASFKNKYSYSADINYIPVWTNALWDLRKKYGQDFVDRLMFYAYNNGYPPGADASVEDFLWSRFMGGLDAIDDNREHFAGVMEIMKSRGLPRQNDAPK